MENRLSHKGFIGSINFSPDNQIFFGRIEGINDLVTFESTTVDGLEEAFKHMVDEHIKDSAWERKLCEPPC